MSLAIGTLVSTAVGFIVNEIKGSKGFKKASDDVSTGVWNWVKSKFAKKDEKLVEDVEKNPEQLEPILKYNLERMATEDPEFAKELEKYVEKAGGVERLAKTNTSTVTGDGNVVIQDFQGNISGNISTSKIDKQINMGEGGTYNEQQ